MSNDLTPISYVVYDSGTGEITQSGNMARPALEWLAKDKGWTWEQTKVVVDHRKFRIDPVTKAIVAKDDPNK